MSDKPSETNQISHPYNHEEVTKQLADKVAWPDKQPSAEALKALAQWQNENIGIIGRESSAHKLALLLDAYAEQRVRALIETVRSCPGETVEGIRWIRPEDAIARIRQLEREAEEPSSVVNTQGETHDS